MDFRGQQPGFDGYQPPPQQHMGPHGMMNPGMMNSNQGGYGDGMMNNMGMPPNTSVMPNNSMMPNANMMGNSAGGGSPMMPPNRSMMPNSSGDTVSVTDPFADNAQSMNNAQFPRPNINYTSGGTMQQNANNFPAGYNRPGMPPNAAYPQGPPGGPGGGGGGGGGGSAPGAGSGGSGSGPGSSGPGSGAPTGGAPGQFGPGGEGMNRQGPQPTEHYPNDPYRRGMAPGPDGYPRGSMPQGQEAFPNQYSGNRPQTMNNQPSGNQYNYGDNRCVPFHA